MAIELSEENLHHSLERGNAETGQVIFFSAHTGQCIYNEILDNFDDHHKIRQAIRDAEAQAYRAAITKMRNMIDNLDV